MPVDKARRAPLRRRRRRRSSARYPAARRDLRSRRRTASPSGELELLSWIISTRRGYSRGKRLRAVSSGARAGVNTPHLSGCGVSFGGAQARAHRLGGHDHLGEAIAHVRQGHRVAGLGDSRRQSEHEFALRDVFHCHLMHHVHDGAGARVQRVASRDVAAQEYALPRHQHVVEDDHASISSKREASGSSKCERPRS